MSGHAAAIFRHPVKGFTPEPLAHVDLTAGAGLPFDRLYAVENGPSGFNLAAPVFIPKQKFVVLASIPKAAAVRSRFDESTSTFHASAPNAPVVAANLSTNQGRAELAAWLTDVLADEVRGALQVVQSPQDWRFFDHPRGHVSLVNLASVRDLGERMGVELDPLRFRANVYVEGWPAWAENQWTGERLMLGWAQAVVFKPIVRCAAIQVDPTTAERDLDVTKALYDNYGHMFCGIYVHVARAGRLHVGDALTTPEIEPARVEVE